jgi:protein subunit release factor B
MKSIIVEIRAGEGGADAKDLVKKQAAIYQKVCARRAL